MSRTVLSHTADTGLEATSGSLAGLIAELAAGMFELMATVDPCADDEEMEFSVESFTTEDLIVDCLSELLYLSETEDKFWCSYEVSSDGERRMTIRVGGVPTASVETVGPPIKAVTYHGLEVGESDEGFHARVFFDV